MVSDLSHLTSRTERSRRSGEPEERWSTIDVELPTPAGRRADQSYTQQDVHMGQTAALSSHAIGEQEMMELRIRRYALIYSAIMLPDGAICESLEAAYTQQKFKIFNNAFSKVGWLLAFFALLSGVISLLSWEDDLRMMVYGGCLAPSYILVSCLSQRSWSKLWLEELVLATLLSMQSVAITVIEWQASVMHFGMLGIHISYIFLFSPLRAVTIHSITIVTSLPLYLCLRWHKSIVDPDSQAGTCFVASQSGRCMTHEGDVPLALDLLVPCIIVAYQTVLMSRRDIHLRWDVLLREQGTWHRRQLRSEFKKCEDLLTSMLPRKIVSLLKADEPVEPQLFEEVTVIFVDVCDFVRLCGRLNPEGVVELLNCIFTELDFLGDLLHVYKVETVMQIYMAVVGCPTPVQNHADVAAHFALAAQQAMPQMKDFLSSIGLEDEKVDIRIGLNSGRIRAGVVGLDKPRFKLFGDTVNTASRMESTCLAGKTQINANVKDRLSNNFVFEERGEIPIKGKGVMNTWFLTGWTEDIRQKQVVQVKMASESMQRVGTMELADEDSRMVALKSMRSMGPVGSIIHGANQVGMQLNLTQKMKDLVQHGPAVFDPFRVDELNRAVVQPHSYVYQRWLDFWYMLVPASEKTPQKMQALSADVREYTQDTLAKRISETRYVTIVWQTLLVMLSGLEQAFDIFEGNDFECRFASFVRSVGLSGAGLCYLWVLTSNSFFRRYYRQITLALLLVQCASFLVTNIILYSNEPTIALLFGGYVMAFPLCDFGTRLAINLISLGVFVAVALNECDSDGESGPVQEILYLTVFLTTLAMGVRLEEHYAHTANYEQRLAEKRVEEMQRARASGAQLLDNLLPPHVARLVSEGVSPIAEFHEDVTIIFTDIKGFTAYSSLITPQELVELLNAMYSAFDEIIVNWGLHKVEIIGDAYFVASGCPVHLGTTEPHEDAMRAVEVALALLRALPGVCEDSSIKMRVGLHSGDVVAGVVGKKGPRYQLFGPTVQKAEMMESTGIPGRVQISDETHSLLVEGAHEYDYEEREIQVDGEGEPIRTWLVNKSRSRAALQIQKDLLRQRQSIAHGVSFYPGGPVELASPHQTTSHSRINFDDDGSEDAAEQRRRRGSQVNSPQLSPSPLATNSRTPTSFSTLKQQVRRLSVRSSRSNMTGFGMYPDKSNQTSRVSNGSSGDHGAGEEEDEDGPAT